MAPPPFFLKGLCGNGNGWDKRGPGFTLRRRENGPKCAAVVHSKRHSSYPIGVGACRGGGAGLFQIARDPPTIVGALAHSQGSYTTIRPSPSLLRKQAEFTEHRGVGLLGSWLAPVGLP